MNARINDAGSNYNSINGGDTAVLDGLFFAAHTFMQRLG